VGKSTWHDQRIIYVAKDGQGREFVEKKYFEVDKNHREGTGIDDTNGDGRMYDRPGSPFCPVASYKKYLSNLHPQLDSLWQRPHDTFNEESNWYQMSRLGVNTINSIMVNISEKAKLSIRYTNHSIRSTSITIMDDAGVEARHIMRVTGHRYNIHFHVLISNAISCPQYDKSSIHVDSQFFEFIQSCLALFVILVVVNQ
jgi:hypothetical protein